MKYSKIIVTAKILALKIALLCVLLFAVGCRANHFRAILSNSTAKISYPIDATESPATVVVKRYTVDGNISSETILTAPKAYAPPSEQDKAKGQGVKWFYIGGALAIPLALIAFWFGYRKEAALIALAAVAMPLTGNLIGSNAALTITAVLGGISAGLFLAWNLLQKRLTKAGEDE